MIKFDYDYVIVGSGFGGSVSAMRLAQKGYSVLVIESGKRWRAKDFPKTNWNVRKFLWMPSLFLYGMQRINLLRNVMILSGAGVGGGSLIYANTLYVPPKPFFNTHIVRKMGGEKSLAPYYELAKKMLGVVKNPHMWEVDHMMKETAKEFGKEKSFTTTPVGVYFGEPNKKVKDPFFGGEGPERVGCNFCGGCMVGCRFDSKNTLDKNYLYFAEKLGAEVLPETKVIELIPLLDAQTSDDGETGAQKNSKSAQVGMSFPANGRHGYELVTKSTTKLFGGSRKRIRARNVILSAGVLGTVGLLQKMKDQKTMPNISERLGGHVLTNSESIVGITLNDSKADHSTGIAITSSVYADEHTHIEPVRYSRGSDVMGMLAAPLMTDGGGRIPRPLRFLLQALRHPIQMVRYSNPFGFAKRTVILLVMQSLDSSIELIRSRRWFWPFWRTLTSKKAEGKGSKIPSFIPIANEFARKLAVKMDGVARSSYNEVLLDIPTTAHILGGASIGTDVREGVIDLQNRVFHYENLMVCDGSMIPANLGVNPSLTITALTERAMSFVPPKKAKKLKTFKFEKKWKVEKVLQSKAKA